MGQLGSGTAAKHCDWEEFQECYSSGWFRGTRNAVDAGADRALGVLDLMGDVVCEDWDTPTGPSSGAQAVQATEASPSGPPVSLASQSTGSSGLDLPPTAFHPSCLCRIGWFGEIGVGQEGCGAAGPEIGPATCGGMCGPGPVNTGTGPGAPLNNGVTGRPGTGQVTAKAKPDSTGLAGRLGSKRRPVGRVEGWRFISHYAALGRAKVGLLRPDKAADKLVAQDALRRIFKENSVRTADQIRYGPAVVSAMLTPTKWEVLEEAVRDHPKIRERWRLYDTKGRRSWWEWLLGKGPQLDWVEDQ